jgi:hypothetical protein
MRMKAVLYSILFTVVLGMTGCNRADRELNNEARKISDAMCKSLDVMHKLQTANPADCVLVRKLRLQVEDNKIEMTTLYTEFRKKYTKQINTPEFNQKFHKLMAKAMLDCKCLSKEDRENFEKDAR